MYCYINNTMYSTVMNVKVYMCSCTYTPSHIPSSPPHTVFFYIIIFNIVMYAYRYSCTHACSLHVFIYAYIHRNLFRHKGNQLTDRRTHIKANWQKSWRIVEKMCKMSSISEDYKALCSHRSMLQSENTSRWINSKSFS